MVNNLLAIHLFSCDEGTNHQKSYGGGGRGICRAAGTFFHFQIP